MDKQNNQNLYLFLYGDPQLCDHVFIKKEEPHQNAESVPGRSVSRCLIRVSKQRKPIFTKHPLWGDVVAAVADPIISNHIISDQIIFIL